MGTIVFCNDDTCRNYKDGVCGKSEIVVDTTYGVKLEGGNGSINVCANYSDRRRKNAGAD